MSLLYFVKMSRMTIEYWSSMASIETCSWPSWIWMWDSWCPRMMCEGHLSQIGINHYHCNRLLILTLARILIMGSSDQYHCHCGFHYHMFWFSHHHRHDNDTTIFDYVFFFLKLVHFRYYIVEVFYFDWALTRLNNKFCEFNNGLWFACTIVGCLVPKRIMVCQ